MDQAKHHPRRALADLLGQVPAGLAQGLLLVALGQHPGAGEGLAQLRFQVGAVGDHQHPAVLQLRVEDQRLGEQQHGDRLARAGGVPDHPALAGAAHIALLDARNQRADAKHLLVTGDDLAVLAVAVGVKAHQLQQAIRPAQAGEQFVLLAGHQATGQPAAVPVQAGGTALGEYRLLLGGSQRAVFQLGEFHLADLFLAPGGPELLSGADRAVTPATAIDHQQQLAKGEQLGDFIGALVAQHLRDALLNQVFTAVGIRPLGLNHHQRQAVHIQHDIRDALADTAGAAYAQLLGEVEAVIARRVPVDQRNGRVDLGPGHKVAHAHAVQQLIGQTLVGRLQPLIERWMTDLGHQLVQRRLAQAVLHAIAAKAPLGQFGAQHRCQHHALLAAAQRQRLTWAQVGKTQVGQQGQGGDLGAEFFLKLGVGNGGGHSTIPCSANHRRPAALVT